MKYRNWVDVRVGMPKEKGIYTVWHSCGVGGRIGRAEFDGNKFKFFAEILEWMDGYKEA